MNSNPIPQHIDAGIDKVSRRARSIQGDNDGLTYNQERRLDVMADLLADFRHGPNTVLTKEQSAALHKDVARTATKEFGRPVSAWSVKLAVKSGLHPPEIKTGWPIDAGEDAYEYLSSVAAEEGISKKAALIMASQALRAERSKRH